MTRLKRCAVLAVLFTVLFAASPTRALVGYSDAKQLAWMKSNPALTMVTREHSEVPSETRNFAHLTARVSVAGMHCLLFSSLAGGAEGEEYARARGVVRYEDLRCDREVGQNAPTVAVVRAVYGSTLGQSFQRATLRARVTDSGKSTGLAGTHAYYAASGAAYAFDLFKKKLTLFPMKDLAQTIKFAHACFEQNRCGSGDY